MYFDLIFVCLLSTASFIKVEAVVQIQTSNDNDIPPIDEQVAPLGTDNVFCMFTYANWVMPANMQQDVPTAAYAGVARLAFHRLDFTSYSEEWKGSFPTVVPDCGYEVWGSVYLIPVQDLDTVLENGGKIDGEKVYSFVQTVVEAYSDGNPINVKCNVFLLPPPEKLIYGLPLPENRRPPQKILDMLIESYIDGGLPQKYIDEVSQIPTRNQNDLDIEPEQPSPTVILPLDSTVVKPDSVVVASSTDPQVQQVQVAQPLNNQQSK